MNLFPYGLGETLGDAIVTSSSLQTPGAVWYVHHTGSDAYAGLDRLKPKATIGAAVAASAGGDTIVMLPGHTESITASIPVAWGLFIVGAGASGGVPTVTLTRSSAAADAMFAVSANNVLFGNVKFAASTFSTPETRISIAASTVNTTVRGCYFESGALDTGVANAIHAGTSVRRLVIKDTTFISTATVVTAQPGPAVGVTAGTAGSMWVMEDVIFSGGTAGWGNYGEAFTDTLSYVTAFRYERVSLLLGADFYMSSSSTGFLNVVTSKSGGQVSW